MSLRNIWKPFDFPLLILDINSIETKQNNFQFIVKTALSARCYLIGRFGECVTRTEWRKFPKISKSGLCNFLFIVILNGKLTQSTYQQSMVSENINPTCIQMTVSNKRIYNGSNRIFEIFDVNVFLSV